METVGTYVFNNRDTISFNVLSRQQTLQHGCIANEAPCIKKKKSN